MLRELRERSSGDEYRPPTRAELAVAEELFEKLLSGGEHDECSTLAATLELRLGRIRHRDHTLIFLTERSAQTTRGWGTFVFRDRGASPDVLLQAPHSRADRLTGAIAQAAFLEGAARAVAFNGARRHASTRAPHPRERTPEGSSGIAGRLEDEPSADVAHTDANLFQSLTRAYARGSPRGLVVQIHGFSRTKRSTAAGRSAHVIVSAGSRPAPDWLRSLEGRLEKSLSMDVALYPDEVKELGATRNRQGALLRASGDTRFLHLELSLSLRRRLVRESDLRGGLTRCWRD